MLTRKCDICGAEMRINTPRYKVTFEGWLYTREKDICIDCFKRISDEIVQADTPQTEQADRIPFDPMTEMTIKQMIEERLKQTEGEDE